MQVLVQKILDPLYDKYHDPVFLSSDPLEFVHRYSDLYDREAVALVAAVLAYGNVKQIRASVEQILIRWQKQGWTPAQAVQKTFLDPKSTRLVYASWVHRFNRGDDLWLLMQLLGRTWKTHGSLGAHLGQWIKPTDLDITAGLSGLIEEWKLWAHQLARKTGHRTLAKSRGFNYLLTSPADGSTCKRWCMLLRWMVRRDRLDLGLWSEWIRTDQLVIPLDTHTGRISQNLGLTQRKSLNWKAAVEVTAALSKLDRHDPVRYDFALCRVGIIERASAQAYSNRI